MTASSAVAKQGEAAGARRELAVWDLGVRAFHWVLVALVAGALGTGFFGSKSLFDVHVIAGTGIAALILLRIIWGFTGSTFARFRSFVTGPLTTLRYARALARNRAAHYTGHNPLGAAMIVALLVTLTVLTATGVAVLGGMFKEGPLAPFTTYAVGHTAKEIHELTAFALIGLVLAHLTGVISESRRTHESLVASMLTGKKRFRRKAIAAPSARARPVVALILGASVIVPCAVAIMSLANLPALGVPIAALDPVYKKECGACHSAHHPSLAPSRVWSAILHGLDDHFGENASLDSAKADALATYLSANSSERWDTRAANWLRKASEEQPLRITKTAMWKRIHRDIPDPVLEHKAVGGKFNCSQCHADAEAGLFAPRSISIPREATPQ